MAVRVRLNDGIRLVVDAGLEEFTKAYQEALQRNELLEVKNGSGRMRVLNPLQILYFEDASEVLSEDGSDSAPEATAAPADDLPVRH